MQFFYDREQKIYFAITVTLVVALLTPILFSGSDFIYKYDENARQQALLKQQQQEQQDATAAYDQILAATKLNADASQKLFKELISEQEVKQQVEAALAVNQPIVLPEVRDADLAISNVAGKSAVTQNLPVLTNFMPDLERKSLLPLWENVALNSLVVNDRESVLREQLSRTLRYLSSMKQHLLSILKMRST
jgi:hypothetical protein